MASPVQPLLDLRAKLGSAARGAEEFADHPADSIEEWLGLSHLPPAQTPDTNWHDQMVRQANQSFVDADKARQAEAAQRAAVAQKFKQMTAARGTPGY